MTARGVSSDLRESRLADERLGLKIRVDPCTQIAWDCYNLGKYMHDGHEPVNDAEPHTCLREQLKRLGLQF